MINTTDLSEFEVLLPGNWVRRDLEDVYSFTNDKMELQDERLFKQLYITHSGEKGRDAFPYALSIEDDYCAILVGDQEFVINSITKHPDGSMDMEWRDRINSLIFFHREAIPG